MTFVTVRRRWTWLLGIAVLLCLGVVFAANAGNFLVIDKPASSDVILVLAGETEQRPARAVELLSQGYAKRIVIDVPAKARIYGFTELELAEKSMARFPQSAEIQICPIVGLSTKDEVPDAAKCMRTDEKSVLIVTSDFHTRRALSIFRHELKGKSFSVAAAHDSEQYGTRWWTHRQWAKTFLDEWLRVIWWNCVDRWI